MITHDDSYPIKATEDQETESNQPLNHEEAPYEDNEVSSQDADDSEQVDLDTVKQSISSQRTVSNPGSGDVTMVNSKDGKRIEVRNTLLQDTGAGNEISVFIGKDKFFIAPATGHGKKYVGKVQKTTTIFYAGYLVNEITLALGLDYSNRTSITFGNVRIRNTQQGFRVAEISVN